MSVITLPAAFQPTTCQLSLRTNQRVTASPFGGSEQAVDLLNDRWMMTCELPPRLMRDGGWLEAFIGQLRGQTNTTRVHHFARPYPLGTIRGDLKLKASALQGAASLSVTGCRPAYSTVKAGDMFEVGGLLVQAASDATSGGVNLLTYSEQFGNAAWAKVNSTVNTGISDPSGGTSATYIDESATVGASYIYRGNFPLTGGKTYTASLYCKKAEDVSVYIWFAGGFFTDASTRRLTYNFTTGVLTDLSNKFQAKSVQALADGWYRISMTFLVDNTIAASAMVIGSENETNTIGSGAYIWGAQLEEGAFLTEYTATTDAPADGDITIPITNRLRVAQSSGADVTWSKPSVSVRLLDTSGVGYAPAIANGASFDFGEAI